jgi:hypothetical protein
MCARGRAMRQEWYVCAGARATRQELRAIQPFASETQDVRACDTRRMKLETRQLCSACARGTPLSACLCVCVCVRDKRHAGSEARRARSSLGL